MIALEHQKKQDQIKFYGKSLRNIMAENEKNNASL
jgi:hypothetical protein